MSVSQTLKHGIRSLSQGKHGPPVILLAGWPQTAEAMLPLLPTLSSKYRLFALDPPGLGSSAAPEGDDYTTANVSKVLSESVSALTSEPVHLVAHDIGVWIAYAWAAQFPEQTRSLTLMDAAIPGMFPPLSYPLSGPVNKKLFQFSFNALPELPEILVEGRERQFLEWLFNSKAVHPGRIRKSSRDIYVNAYSGAGKMSQGFAYYRAAEKSAEQNAKFANKKLQVPLLALGGSSAVGAGMGVMAAKISDNVQSHVVEDCGHFLPEEQPDAVAKYIWDFLESLENKSDDSP